MADNTNSKTSVKSNNAQNKEETSSETKRKGGLIRNIIVGVVAVLIFFCVCYGIYYFMNKDSSAEVGEVAEVTEATGTENVKPETVGGNEGHMTKPGVRPPDAKLKASANEETKIKASPLLKTEENKKRTSTDLVENKLADSIEEKQSFITKNDLIETENATPVA